MILTSVQMWIINGNPFCIRAEHLLHEMWGIFHWLYVIITSSRVRVMTCNLLVDAVTFVNFNFTNMCVKPRRRWPLFHALQPLVWRGLLSVPVGVCVFKVSRSKSASTDRTPSALWWALNINGYIKFLTIEHLILNPRNFLKSLVGLFVHPKYLYFWLRSKVNVFYEKNVHSLLWKAVFVLYWLLKFFLYHFFLTSDIFICMLFCLLSLFPVLSTLKQELQSFDESFR